jgi:hypothetical protein
MGHGQSSLVAFLLISFQVCLAETLPQGLFFRQRRFLFRQARGSTAGLPGYQGSFFQKEPPERTGSSSSRRHLNQPIFLRQPLDLREKRLLIKQDDLFLVSGSTVLAEVRMSNHEPMIAGMNRLEK